MSDVRDIDFEDGSGHGGSLEFSSHVAARRQIRSPRDRLQRLHNTGIAYARGEIDAAVPWRARRAHRDDHDDARRIYRDNSIGLGWISTSRDFHPGSDWPTRREHSSTAAPDTNRATS
jgi:hypothetical protein